MSAEADSACNSLRESSERLVELVTSNSSSDDAEIKLLISRLEGAGATLVKDSFSGPWEVVWSEGTMAWRALVAKGVQAIAGNCRAGQAFDVEKRQALNFAELFDGRCEITAEGTFTPVTEALAPCPVAFDVAITRGAIIVGTRQFDLPISGPGFFEILYGDASVRVFRSSGGLAVQ
eukprot:gene2790-3582_t